MHDRSTIVARLREIASLIELAAVPGTTNKFKARAFVRGARSLEASRMPIEKLIETKRLTELPGIGDAIARQIEEIYRSEDATSELLLRLRKAIPTVVREKHARRARSKRRQIRLADALALADSLAEDLHGDLVGDVRRAMEMSPSVDLLIPTKNEENTIAQIEASSGRFVEAARDDAGNATSLHGRMQDGTLVKVFACKPEARAAAMVLRTGPEAHVAMLRERAAKKGLELREDGVFRRGKLIPMREEAALYEALGLSFVPPEVRDEAKRRDDSFFDLVKESDIQGFVHCHSTWSDGRHSIEQMVRAAAERGAKFITITDHSKTAHYANGLDVDRLRRQWDEIDEVQESIGNELGIRIFKGTEADIVSDGAIDWPDDILEELDVVIASIHSRYKQGEDAMTARVLRAMRYPIFKIWGHPLGRLVPSRPPIPLRIEEVLDALAESEGGGAIEINGDPYRMDLEPKWAKEARVRGLSFVLSVDAHSMPELRNVRIATALARRAGIRRGDVLNALHAKEFAKAVRP